METDTPKATSQQAKSVSVFKVSSVCVCVCGGKNYTADEAVNRHKKSELRVGYSLTHWGQTFKTRHLRLSKSGTADYRINENILL